MESPVNYYEELGLSATASNDEIKRAYKTLARVLHPDRTQDARLRRTVEAQMKRLNQVYATLSDAARRRAYDRSLLVTAVIAPPRAQIESAQTQFLQLAMSRWRPSYLAVWLVAGSLVAGILYGMLRDSTVPVALPAPASGQLTPSLPPPPRQSTNGAEAVNRLSRPAITEVQRLQASQRELRQRIYELEHEREAAIPQPTRSEIALAEVAPGESPPPRPIVGSAPPSPEPAVSGNRLVGSWFYAPRSRSAPSQQNYAAEYIEAVIVEQGGQIQGRYRARYRVSDRAISPDVLFQFRGDPGQEALDADWMGIGGARGEVKLRLLSENQLEVVWIANELGRVQGLGSGKAVLVRRRMP
jgi:DnaJ domain